jgi:hypothetical protein
MVSENRVLRKIFGPRRGEVTGRWRKFRTEELHNLYSQGVGRIGPNVKLGHRELRCEGGLDSTGS